MVSERVTAQDDYSFRLTGLILYAVPNYEDPPEIKIEERLVR